MVQWTLHSCQNKQIFSWQITISGPSDKMTDRTRGVGSDNFLATSGLATSPGSGPRTWTGAWSWYGPGPGAGWGVCPSHLFLGVMGSRCWVDVFSWRCRFGAWSGSPSGLSPRPLPVSEDHLHSSFSYNTYLLNFNNLIWLRLCFHYNKLPKTFCVFVH